MKNVWRVTFFILFVCLLVNPLFSEEKDSVLLKGMVYNNKDRVKNVVVKIYEDNNLLKEIHVKSTNRFKTYLPVNKKLTIAITAEEYFPKRFIFDTSMPEEIKKVPDYEFDIDIFKLEELEGVNTSFLDFPVGIVTYNERKGEFLRNKKYTKQMKKAYLKLWDEAQSLERAGFEEEENENKN